MSTLNFPLAAAIREYIIAREAVDALREQMIDAGNEISGNPTMYRALSAAVAFARSEQVDAAKRASVLSLGVSADDVAPLLPGFTLDDIDTLILVTAGIAGGFS